MIWLMLSPYVLIVVFFAFVYFLLDFFAMLSLSIYLIWIILLPLVVFVVDEKNRVKEEQESEERKKV
ncbi:hypothetical protein [Pseudalkalibacillus sp. SCS-8]|uniref:hypothetical protein n=1 Tax=Pseudalkalibacillus nanhaiensis TaxID=3115291 RepID=UPI0032DA41EB